MIAVNELGKGAGRATSLTSGQGRARPARTLSERYKDSEKTASSGSCFRLAAGRLRGGFDRHRGPGWGKIEDAGGPVEREFHEHHDRHRNCKRRRFGSKLMEFTRYRSTNEELAPAGGAVKKSG